MDKIEHKINIDAILYILIIDNELSINEIMTEKAPSDSMRITNYGWVKYVRNYD